MALLLKIFKQTFWQMVGKVVTSVSTFIILGLVARNYGEEGTGVFTLSLTYLVMFYLLSDFGFNAHTLREVKDKKLKFKSEWRKLLGVRLLWSVVLVVIATITLPFWPFSTLVFSQAVLYGSLAIVGSAVFISCNLLFQSKLRYDLSVLALILGTIVSLGFYVHLILQKTPVQSLLLAHLSGWLIIAAVAILLMKKFIPNPFPIFNRAYTRQLFSHSWPIAATLALNIIYFRADSFLIAFYKGASDVGVYSVAYSVFQSVLVLPTFIMNSYYPLMLKSLKAAKGVGLGLLGLATLATLLILVLSPEIINLLTGSGFFGSAHSLQILSLGFPAYFLSSLLMWMMVTKGEYKLMLKIYTVGLIFNLILNFIYIPQYSFLAASWTTVISEYVILAMQIAVLRGRVVL